MQQIIWPEMFYESEHERKNEKTKSEKKVEDN